MRSTLTSLRRTLIAAGAAAMLLSLGFTAPADAAHAGPSLDRARAFAVTRSLGRNSLGFYLDQATGKFIFPVTDADAARSVRASGGVPKLVTRGPSQLNAGDAALRRAALRGVAWSIDPVTDRVDVQVDATLAGAGLARLHALIARFGDAVHVEHVASATATLQSSPKSCDGNTSVLEEGVQPCTISGGNVIYTDAGFGAHCTVGFNAHDPAHTSTVYFLTAGHCAAASTDWYIEDKSGLEDVATRSHWTTSGGNDYGVIHYTDSKDHHAGVVELHTGKTQDITSAGGAYVGEPVTFSGSTTDLALPGKVLSVNASFTACSEDGKNCESVTHAIETSICTYVGDSGGPLFDHYVGLGTLIGEIFASGDCHSYFQAIVPVLAKYGLTVY